MKNTMSKVRRLIYKYEDDIALCALPVIGGIIIFTILMLPSSQDYIKSFSQTKLADANLGQVIVLMIIFSYLTWGKRK